MTRRAIPVVHFESGQDKDAIAAAHRATFTAREGVVLLGIAQEKVRSFKVLKQTGPGVKVRFEFSRQCVAVKQFYFYVHDGDWGPAFVKISTYLPYPVKLCLNGHEWVKQQLRRQRLRFESLDNGFLSCADPVALQTACDALGPADVQAFFDRWSHQLRDPAQRDDELEQIGVRLLPERLLGFPEQVVEQAADRVRDRVGVEIVVQRVVADAGVESDFEVVGFATSGPQHPPHLPAEVTLHF